MRALLVYIALVVAIVLAVLRLIDAGGEVTMAWGVYEVATTVPVLAFGVVAVALAAVFLAGVAGWLWRGPRRVRSALGRRRRERGYKALTRGLVAVAAGDASEARRHARRADGLLGHPPLTLLLAAQAAQLDGDDEVAEDRFRAMLERPETEFLGLRGLMSAALRRGDRPAARDFATRAHELRPDARWAAEAVVDLQTRDGDWSAARSTLETALDRKALPAATGRRRRAALLIEEGRLALASLDRARALRRAREAHAEAPDLTPATALYARLLIDEQKLRPAARAIERSWAEAAHPDLAALYAETGRDSGVARYRRVAKLAGLAPNSRESHLASARAALDAGLSGEARRHLHDLGDEPVTKKAARLWVELAEMEDDAGEAARWRELAVDAGPEAAWRCADCGRAGAEWHAVCPGCGAFDTAAWRAPDDRDAAPPRPGPRLV